MKGEVNQIKEVKDKNPRVAAFFDLDGTLLPPPPLEQRFFRTLCYRREIPFANCFSWWIEALKLLPRGINHVMHRNKMYLRGVHSFNKRDLENRSDSSGRMTGGLSRPRESDEGQASTSPRRNPRWPVPRFFEDGVERVTLHARQGHAIVIVSGTLEPLAAAAGRTLQTELAARGIAAEIHVCATELEESDGRWTGRILGEAMFGKAKARAILSLAEKMSLDLSQSWAYGDSARDRWILASVGNPVAVNPSARLARIAKKRGWSVLRWRGEKNLTQSSQRAQRHREHRDKKKDMREARATESLPGSQEIQKQLRHVERRA